MHPEIVVIIHSIHHANGLREYIRDEDDAEIASEEINWMLWRSRVIRRLFGKDYQLKKHFESSNTEKTTVRKKLNSLRQLGTVSKYNDLFNSLIIEILEMDEKTKIEMYCRGLKSNIQLQGS